jgi:hypothetical protein
VGHLLQVGRDVRVVAPKVGVVELDVDDVLDVVAAAMAETARKPALASARNWRARLGRCIAILLIRKCLERRRRP